MPSVKLSFFKRLHRTVGGAKA